MISTKSISSRDNPALSSASLEAGAGPIPITCGSTPTKPHEMIRPKGSIPFASAHSALARIAVAEPSPMPLALPAVTKPSSLKYGLRAERPSTVVSGRMCSSALYVVSPFLVLSPTPVTSMSKRPSSHAALALCCE